MVHYISNTYVSYCIYTEHTVQSEIHNLGLKKKNLYVENKVNIHYGKKITS